MTTVYRCWHRATGEELAATGATALFGDRRAGCSEEQEKQFRPLEQPWRVLHAAIVVALDKANAHAVREPHHKVAALCGLMSRQRKTSAFKEF